MIVLRAVMGAAAVAMFVAVGVGATSPVDYALGIVTAALAVAGFEVAENMHPIHSRAHKPLTRCE